MADRIIVTHLGTGVCVGGRFDGWLMRKYPDGQWVSVCKLETEDPYEGLPDFMKSAPVTSPPPERADVEAMKAAIYEECALVAANEWGDVARAIEAGIRRRALSTERGGDKPFKMMVTPEWLRDKVENDPDFDTEASPPPAESIKAMRAALAFIENEASDANTIIAMKRDDAGNGRVKIATALHRIEKEAHAALSTVTPKGE